MNILNRRHALGAALALAAASAFSVLPAPAFAGPRTGMVFTSSNDAGGNELLVYARSADGGLAMQSHVGTGGLGLGAGLGSQGAVTLSGDGRFVYVVNAGSDSIATFKLSYENGMVLKSTVPSGGSQPISVTEHEGLVYVLNAGGDGNIAGFRNDHGVLMPVEGSVRGLSQAGGVGPAQVGFTTDGRSLVVSEKMTNRLTTYRVKDDGSASMPMAMPSAGVTPFGFAINRRNRLIVSEAVGGAPEASTVSSYSFMNNSPAMPMVVSAAVPDTQTAACWVAVTPDGHWAYVTNTGSSSVSRYHVAPDGALMLTEAAAGDTGPGSAPIDAAVSSDGGHLYVLNAKSSTLSSFHVRPDGSLGEKPRLEGLPAAAAGLAAN